MKRSKPTAPPLQTALRSLLLVLAAGAVSTPALAAEPQHGEAQTPESQQQRGGEARPDASAPTDADAAAAEEGAQRKPASPCAPKKKKRKSPCAIGG